MEQELFNEPEIKFEKKTWKRGNADYLGFIIEYKQSKKDCVRIDMPELCKKYHVQKQGYIRWFTEKALREHTSIAEAASALRKAVKNERQRRYGEKGTNVQTKEENATRGKFEENNAKQNIMEVNIKKLCDDAVIPSYAKPGDAGMDLTATSIEYDKFGNIVYHTGIAVEIPEGFVGLVFPRSSNAKTELYLTNSVGVIDSGYRGEITLKYKTRNTFPRLLSIFKILLGIGDNVRTINFASKETTPKVGDRVGQLIIMPYPSIKFIEAAELSTTERGNGGYGSTGK